MYCATALSAQRQLLTGTKYIQNPLRTTNLKDTLESMSLLSLRSKRSGAKGFEDRHGGFGLLAPLEYLSLQHLTFTPTSRYLPDFRLGAQNLTSLYIVLDDCAFMHERWAAKSEYFPGFSDALRHCTISGKKDLIRHDVLFECIDYLLEREFPLPLLTIRDLQLIVDYG